MWWSKVITAGQHGRELTTVTDEDFSEALDYALSNEHAYLRIDFAGLSSDIRTRDIVS